jgi:hypothetical protein
MMSSGMSRRVALVRTQEPHRVTSQKTQFFTVTAVKTSNLTWLAMSYFRKLAAIKHNTNIGESHSWWNSYLIKNHFKTKLPMLVQLAMTI